MLNFHILRCMREARVRIGVQLRVKRKRIHLGDGMCFRSICAITASHLIMSMSLQEMVHDILHFMDTKGLQQASVLGVLP